MNYTQNRMPVFAAIAFALLALLFCGLWLQIAFFNGSRLVGEWQYATHSPSENFFPKYESTLSFKPDESFTKIERYTASPDSPTVTSTFNGSYMTKGNFESGTVFIALNEGIAKVGGEVVGKGPSGGYGATFPFAFNTEGHLLIADNVDTQSGYFKNLGRLTGNRLLPSWGTFSRD